MAQCLGIGKHHRLSRRVNRSSHRLGLLDTAEPPHEYGGHFQRNERPHRRSQREVLPEPFAQTFNIYVEHHHDKQEENHHSAQIHQHQGNCQEFRPEQQPQAGCLRKGKNQMQHGMHRVAGRNHPEGCIEQHDREQIEKTSLGVHESVLCRGLA